MGPSTQRWRASAASCGRAPSSRQAARGAWQGQAQGWGAHSGAAAQQRHERAPRRPAMRPGRARASSLSTLPRCVNRLRRRWRRLRARASSTATSRCARTRAGVRAGVHEAAARPRASARRRVPCPSVITRATSPRPPQHGPLPPAPTPRPLLPRGPRRATCCLRRSTPCTSRYWDRGEGEGGGGAHLPQTLTEHSVPSAQRRAPGPAGTSAWGLAAPCPTPRGRSDAKRRLACQCTTTAPPRP